ncbi:unannotated protein [freshwater metagenome]|uniref:Unannotated protein n=1 Tax=freshwater metagenome TaxID=449393 RepID=A0A6J6V0W4_9ZZZZ
MLVSSTSPLGTIATHAATMPVMASRQWSLPETFRTSSEFHSRTRSSIAAGGMMSSCQRSTVLMLRRSSLGASEN